MKRLVCGNRVLDVSRPVVMGILNATPDSFSDGGGVHRNGKLDVDAALRRASIMVEQGACIIDVGGESTRPGASAVSVDEELQRVIPVVKAIHAELDVVISVDTSSAAVMTEAAKAGAGLLNDVRALQGAGALEAAVQARLPVCIMHMQGKPDTMQDKPDYDNVVDEVLEFFRARVDVIMSAGITREQIIVDPGYGFGKSVEHNLALIRHLAKLVDTGFPILVGLSRKSLFGHLLGREVNQRLAGSLAGAILAAQAGANIIRVHDVAETVDALAVLNAVQSVSLKDESV